MKDIISFDKTTALRIEAENRCALQPVPPESRIHFPLGLPAFEDIQDYVILLNDDVRPFVFLQALHRSSLCFVCIEPFLFYPEYSVPISNAAATTLGIEEPGHTVVLCLVTVSRSPTDSTVNLLGPVLINLQTMLGQQVIVDGSDYPVRYRLWDALQARESLHAAG